MEANGAGLHRVVREGGKRRLYTIGYERRSGDAFITALLSSGIEYVADIREKPISRRPDFRAASLRERCKANGIEYHEWKRLGSTQSQRDALTSSGDIDRFFRKFRAFAKRYRSEDLERLRQVVRSSTAALLCYERTHEECHRSVIAELLADPLNSTIVAIV